jgi:hypothetical protein
MAGSQSLKAGPTTGKILSVYLMIFCLTFLTAINFFLYPVNCDKETINYFGMNSEESENDFPPSGPTEEKNTSSNGTTLAEEMLHECHPEVEFEATNLFYLHHIAESEKIEIFHPEILLPPPKFIA